MTIDFFETNCKEVARTSDIFGLCDDQDGSKAYSDEEDTSKCIAVVKNKSNNRIVFTAIDNCIVLLKEGTKDKESTCDGMLTFAESLYLVELKNKSARGWISDAVGQLENTIKLLKIHHNIDHFRYKKAFACNKKRPHFVEIDTEAKLKFFRKYGFRIDVNAEITIR